MNFKLFLLAVLVLLTALGFSQNDDTEEIAVPVPGTEYIALPSGERLPKEIRWTADDSIMVLIPGGTFQQGLSEDNGGTRQEYPVREVTVSPFYIDKYEISNGQYTYFQERNAVPVSKISGNPGLKAENHPVTGIGWDYARQYANHVGKELPTEAQWELAARGPYNTIYTTGDQKPDSETVIYNRGINGVTVPVNEDTGDVSGWGVYHMGGNVSEFCRDHYQRDAYRENPGPVTDPLVQNQGEGNVIRGGSFVAKENEPIRATYRRGMNRAAISDYVGFRTVWVLKKEERQKITPTPTPIPTLSEEDILTAFKRDLSRFLERDTVTLPQEMMASARFQLEGTGELNFVNFTPFRVMLTFVSLDHERVFRYKEPVPSMSTRRIDVTKGVTLDMLAYVPDLESTSNTIFELGQVRAESGATVVLYTEFFSPVVTGNGDRLEPTGEVTAPQYYQAFTPKWNELEIHNTLELPVVVRFDDIMRGADEAEFVYDFTIDPDDTLRLDMTPNKYRITAEYIGAIEESSEPLELLLDDSASRRLINLREAELGTVIVITEKKPKIDLQLIDMNLIR